MPKLLSKKEFLCLARKTHGYKYEYERTDYKGFRKKIVITCPKHGDFIQLVAKHIRGQGCPQCAIQTRTNLFSSDKATFVSKAEKVHAGKYSYEYTNYVNDRTKVSITCPLHGLFEQTPNNHLRGYGCIQCGGGGQRAQIGKLSYEKRKQYMEIFMIILRLNTCLVKQK